MAKTVIHKNDTPYFGNKELIKIAPVKSFSSLIFELLSGSEPKKNQLILFETILNISIDHGSDTPSAIETIKSSKEGKSISESVASGIKQINDMHGGAIEPAMELFYRIKNENLDIEKLVDDYIESGLKVAGFGHRIYKKDPRSTMIFELAHNQMINEEFIKIAKKIEELLTTKKGRALPINIDGAIAAILCSFEWPKELGKAVFIIARTPGLCGQYLNNF